jgi:hypothetical protein
MNTWKQDCRILFAIETKKYLSWRKLRKPSFLLATICMSLAALPILAFRESADEACIQNLKKHGWQEAENAPCNEKLRAQHYYEIDLGRATRDLYYSETSRIFLSPLREEIDTENTHCRPIKKPSFVEEL